MVRRASLVALALSSLVSLVVVGCAAPTGDEAADESVDEASESALSSNPNGGFFIVTRRDFRKCSAPMCGGVYVKRVNSDKTRCTDGKYRDECYVGDVEYTKAGLGKATVSAFAPKFSDGKALVRATLRTANFGRLEVVEAWEGKSGNAPEGTFYRAADNGIRCVKAPCPSTTASTLNSKEAHNVSRVDFTPSGVAKEIELQSNIALGTKEGVIVAGGLAMPKCKAATPNCGPWISANEVYLRVQASTLGQGCGSWSGATCAEGEFCAWRAEDICGAADAPGVCTKKPEACTALYKPVCGCDGATYSNACMAASSGVSVSADGPCAPPSTLGQACGGLLGAACSAGEFCLWQPKDICGAADAMGVCSVRPDACPMIYKPVCGCDNKTYSNGCVAASAGMSVVSDGECK